MYCAKRTIVHLIPHTKCSVARDTRTVLDVSFRSSHKISRKLLAFAALDAHCRLERIVDEGRRRARVRQMLEVTTIVVGVPTALRVIVTAAETNNSNNRGC